MQIMARKNKISAELNCIGQQNLAMRPNDTCESKFDYKEWLLEMASGIEGYVLVSSRAIHRARFHFCNDSAWFFKCIQSMFLLLFEAELAYSSNFMRFLGTNSPIKVDLDTLFTKPHHLVDMKRSKAPSILLLDKKPKTTPTASPTDVLAVPLIAFITESARFSYVLFMVDVFFADLVC